VSRNRDPSQDVFDMLRQRDEPVPKAEIVQVLRNAHDEAAVLRGIEHWTEEGEIVVDDDDYVWLRGRNYA